MTRVVVIGSECTGKTTLAADLARERSAVWSPEFAREYVDRVARALTFDDVEPIARGQQAGEDEAAARARNLLILDTDLVSTCVYSRHYYGRCPAWLEDLARSRLADLYLLLGPDVPWVADGLQREQPERREALHTLFRDTLRRWGARFVEVRGTWAARRARAEGAIDALRRAPGRPRVTPG